MDKKTIANAIINELRGCDDYGDPITDAATHFSVDQNCAVYAWSCKPRFEQWDECQGADFEEWLSGKPGVHTCLQHLGDIAELPDGCKVSDLCFEVELIE